MSARDRPTRADELENTIAANDAERTRARRLRNLVTIDAAPLRLVMRIAYQLRQENGGQLEKHTLQASLGRLKLRADLATIEIAIRRTAPGSR